MVKPIIKSVSEYVEFCTFAQNCGHQHNWKANLIRNNDDKAILEIR